MTTWTRFEKAAFAAYAVWMGVGLALTARHVEPGPWGDFILIALAALNIFLIGRSWGWFLWVVAASAAIESYGVATGVPFGSYSYTGAFGPRLGPLPLAIPLAWYVLVGAGTEIFRALRRVPRAVGTAALVTALDGLMEPFAVRIKGYWIWHTATGAAPGVNYAAWAGTAFFLALAAPPRYGGDLRPWAVLGSMAGLFILARSVYGI